MSIVEAFAGSSGAGTGPGVGAHQGGTMSVTKRKASVQVTCEVQ